MHINGVRINQRAREYNIYGILIEDLPLLLKINPRLPGNLIETRVAVGRRLNLQNNRVLFTVIELTNAYTNRNAGYFRNHAYSPPRGSNAAY